MAGGGEPGVHEEFAALAHEFEQCGIRIRREVGEEVALIGAQSPGGENRARDHGVAKGVGMIEPDMATMLAFITTDAEVPADVLGVGRVTIRATGRAGFGIANTVNAEPVTIEVVPAD